MANCPSSNHTNSTCPIPILADPARSGSISSHARSTQSGSSSSSSSGHSHNNSGYSSDLLFPMDIEESRSSESSRSQSRNDVRLAIAPRMPSIVHSACRRCGRQIPQWAGLADLAGLCEQCRARQQTDAARGDTPASGSSAEQGSMRGVRARYGMGTPRPFYGFANRPFPARNMGPSSGQFPPGVNPSTLPVIPPIVGSPPAPPSQMEQVLLMLGLQGGQLEQNSRSQALRSGHSDPSAQHDPQPSSSDKQNGRR
ncbi:hypothetical protein B0H21DRAFT_13594 [Amylocystis lapponica]|nr:hypothetical protein B0H21DRAFT_13594 [Amylocystis lapponica]